MSLEAQARAVLNRKEESDDGRLRREAWHAMKTHLPELASQLPEIVRVFGPLSAVRVETREETWEWRRSGVRK